MITYWSLLFLAFLYFEGKKKKERKKEEAPVCVTCDTVITIKHVLIECTDFIKIRKKYLEERSLYLLFRNVNPERVFDFLREAGVFYKI